MGIASTKIAGGMVLGISLPKTISRSMEEIVEASRIREYKKFDSSTASKTPSRGPFPLPPPPKSAPGKLVDSKALEHLDAPVMADCLYSVYAFCKA